MSAFAGVVTFDTWPGSKQLEERIRSAVATTSTERVHVMRSNGALFVQRIADYPAGKSAGPIRTDRAIFAASVRLDNRDELAAALQVPPSQLAGTDDALLMHAVDRWGEAGVARCLGAFAFVHWNPTDRRLTLGRDCIGNRSLYFYRASDFVAFASTLTILLRLPEVPRELDEIALALILAQNLSESRHTVYRSIERVPSRTLVTIDPAGVKHRHYWSPNPDAAPPYRRADDYIERARELFDQAVLAATKDSAHVAISTSGGLDSSAVAATVARQGQAECITCYTLVPAAGTRLTVAPHRYLDERPKLEALRRMYPAIEVHFLAPETPHPLIESDRHYFAASSMPSPHQTNLGLFGFLDDTAMAAGHRRLLAGYRGNFGLNWRGDFSLVTLLRHARFFEFCREYAVLAQQSDAGLARTFVREVVMRVAPIGLRRWIDRLRGRDPYSIAWVSALNPDFVRDHDLTAKWRWNGFDPRRFMPFADPVRHRGYFLFDHNQFARDRMGSLAYERGIEHVDPHADRRLLEFALTVPEPLFRQNGVPRSFGRAVFADRLPAEILNERRSGVQDANWFRRLNVRRPALAADIERLEASPTARRLIDLPRLKRLLDQWPADEQAAETLGQLALKAILVRAVHIGNFVRWVEGGNM